MCVLLHLLICTALRAHIIVVEALYKINYYYYYYYCCCCCCFGGKCMVTTRSPQTMTDYIFHPTLIAPAVILAFATMIHARSIP